MAKTGKTGQFEADLHSQRRNIPWGAEVLSWILTALLLAFALSSFQVQAEEPTPQKRVLILYSFENEIGFYSEFDATLRTGLKAGGNGPIEFFTEYLDLVRITSPHHERDLENYLKQKYSAAKIDLIVPVSIPAINFIRSHGSKLFGKTPVVLCAVDRRWMEGLRVSPNMTGVVETTKIVTTLAVALQLHPDTRRVYVVGGNLPYEQDWTSQVQSDLRDYESKLDITYLTGLPMKELSARLSSLPPHSVVLFVMMWRDGGGEYFLPQEALIRISRVSKAPIYGLFEGLLGSGMVGGDLVSFEGAGAVAAEMGTRILKGTKPSDLPIVYEDNASYKFDGRELQRWHIREDRLPFGSHVLFRAPSFWALYKWRIVGALALLAAQAAIIALLLVQRRKRKRAESALRMSEERYRSLVESSHDWVWETDSEGVYTYVGPQCEKILGYEAKELIGKKPFDLMPPEEARRVGLAFSEIVAQRKPFRGLENTNLSKDGRLIYLETNGVPIFDERSNFLGFRGMDRDISERRHAEENLRRSESRYQQLYANMIDSFIRVDLAGRILECNDAYCMLTGYSREELLELTYMELTPEKWHAFEADLIQKQVYQQGHSDLYQKEYRHKDGRVVPIELRTHLMRDEAGNPCGLWAIVRDITEHKRLENDLRENAALLSRILEATSGGVWDWNIPSGNAVFSPRYATMLGYAPEEFPTHYDGWSGLVHPDDVHRVKKAHADHIVGNQDFSVEFRMKEKSGNWHWVHSRALLIERDAGGKPVRMVGTHTDIQERKQAEEALQKAEKEYRNIFENALEGIYRTTPDGKCIAANPALARILGFDSAQEAVFSITDAGLQSWADAEERARFIRLLEEQNIIRGYECQFKRKNGTHIWVSISTRRVPGPEGGTLYYEGFIEDVTERRLVMEALQQRATFDELMTRAISSLASTPDSGLDEAVEMALKSISEFIGADHAYVVRFLTEGASWRLTHEWCGPNVTSKLPQYQGVPIEISPLIKKRLLAGEVTKIDSPDDFPSDATADRQHREREGYLSALDVPISSRAGVIGAIGLHSHSKPKAWLDKDVAHVRMIGDAMAIALEQKRNMEELRKTVDALERRAAFNELMTRTLSSFATSPLSELDAAVEKALQMIAEFIGVDHAYVIRISADRTSWSGIYEWCGSELTPRIQLTQNIPIGSTPRVENLILAGEVSRINSPDDFPPEAVTERRNQANEGYLSGLNVPIRARGGIFGTIGLHSHARLLVWTDDDVTHLRMVGDAIANAIEHKHAMEELQRSEEKFSKAFHGSPTAMTIISVATGRYIDVNRSYEEHTGYAAKEILGHTPQEVGIYTHPMHLDRIKQALQGGAHLRDLEVEYQTKTGEPRVALLSTEVIEFGGEPCTLKVVDDITDRQRAEKVVMELGARMLMVQEAERRRVARELHDDFSQRLALLAIDLEQLSQQSSGNRPDWGRRLRAMWSQTQELNADIHRLSHQLHPAKLEDLGLVMAVRSFCNEVARQTKVAVEFSEVNVPRFLPSEISLCLYRIVQEALRNVVKHSGSKTAAVNLSMGTDEIRLTISDCGKGFDLEVAKVGEGLGLISMVERARFAGGILSIDSVTGRGTQVEVRIPLPSPATSQ